MTTMSTENVGAAVRSARLQLDWSQADLASKLGVSREWVCKMESGAPRLEFDKVLSVMAILGFNILAPDDRGGPSAVRRPGPVTASSRPDPGALVTEVPRRKRATARARQRALAAIEVGQQMAGHNPSAEAMARAAAVLDGELDIEAARAEILAKHRARATDAIEHRIADEGSDATGTETA